jgi:archaellum biogenesis protein FlaJ (TadC family)
MPEALVNRPSPAAVRLDRQLIASLMLSPFAVLANTIVGYTVAHWVCDVNRKTTDYIVCAIDLAICVLAAVLAFTALRQLPKADDSQPQVGRRRFMAVLALMLSALAAIVVIAGTLATLTVQPCD